MQQEKRESIPIRVLTSQSPPVQEETMVLTDGIPATKCLSKRVVKHLDTDLQKLLSSLLSPSHLLFFNKAFADDFVNSGFDEG
jgi:hypothetical protein